MLKPSLFHNKPNRNGRNQLFVHGATTKSQFVSRRFYFVSSFIYFRTETISVTDTKCCGLAHQQKQLATHIGHHGWSRKQSLEACSPSFSCAALAFSTMRTTSLS